MAGRKFEKAWDNKLKKWVKPEEVKRAEAHDILRYFSEEFKDDEDRGKVLTLHKESKPFKVKSGKEVIRKPHFSTVADNTREYRKDTIKKANRQESLVHRLCKEEINKIEFIKVPEYIIETFGVNHVLIPEQYIKIEEVTCKEKKDHETGRIPDAVIKAKLYGKLQEIKLEFFYSHAVDENKRKQYEYYKINCLEVDISYLKDNLELTETSLRNKIREAITNECYWVSCRLHQIIEKDLLLEISKAKNNLRDSQYYIRSKMEDLEKYYQKRVYMFRDSLNVPSDHPCAYRDESDRCVNIGECYKCSNCVHVSNYKDYNTNNIKIYCRKVNFNRQVDKENIIIDLINNAIELLN